MPNARNSSQHSRLLVVDDDASQLSTLVRIFETEGFDVVGCSTGTEALEHLRGGDVGVAVVDLRLPDLSGTELLAKLETLSTPVQVILHTAYGSFESAKEAVNLGAFAYVEKGTEYDKLIRHVHRAFRTGLERHAAWLEEAVAERTRKLEEANEILKREVADRMAAEEGLSNATMKWERTFDALPDPIVILDNEYRITRANRAMAQRLGREPEDCVGLTCYRYVHGTEEPPPYCPHAQLLKDGQEHHVEIREEGLGGHFLVSVCPLSDTTGRPIGSVHVARDVTERKEAEQALRESEQRFRLLYEKSPLAYQSLDEEGRFLEVNDAWLGMLGYNRKEVVGRSCGDFLTPEYLERFKERFPRFKAMGDISNVQFEMIRKDGSEITIEVDGRVGYDNDGNFLQTHCILRDITRRRRAEEAYRTLVDNSLQGLVILQDGRALFANQTLADMLGCTISALLGMSHEELRQHVHPDDREWVWRRHQERIEGGGPPPQYEHRLVHENGDVRWVEIIASRTQVQNRPAIQIAFLDITDRKRAERVAREQHDLAVALSSTTDFDEGLRLSLETALRISTMDCGGVYLVDENSGAVDLVFHQGLSKDFINDVSHFDRESDRARLIMAGEPVYVEYDQAPMQLTETQKREGLGALAVLPIKHEARVIGCLNIASHTLSEVPVFAHVALEAIAAQIGSSLARLRVEEETKELAQAAVELVRLSPLDDIASFICDKVGELAGDAIVGVSLIDTEHGTLRIQKVIGTEPDKLNVIDGLLEHRVTEGLFDGVSEEAVRQLASGKLSKLDGGLSEMFFGRVPESICDSIEWTVGVRDVHSIGLVSKGRLLGNVTILPRAGARLNGNVIEAFVNAASIALERKQAEEALRTSEERYRAIFHDNRAVKLLIDPETGQIMDANPAACEFYGYAYEDFTRMRIMDINTLSETKVRREMERAAREERTFFQFRHRLASGNVLDVEVHSGPVPVGGRELLFSIVTDVTKRKQAEEALRESEAKHRILFESSRDAIMTLAPPSWEFTSGNPACVALFGARDEAEFTSHPPWALSPKHQPDGRPSGEKAREMIDTAMRKRSHFFEWTHKRVDGQEFSADVLLTRIELGEQALLQATVRDITPRKKAEEELRQRDAELVHIGRLATMGELAAGLAHELNQPLYAITNYATGMTWRLRDGVDDPGELNKTLEKVMAQARRAADIIDRLRRAVKKREPRMTPTNLNELLRDLLKLVGHEIRLNSVILRLDLQKDLPSVLADDIQIQQVALNLVRNAVDAMRDVPSNQRYLTLTTSVTEDDMIEVGVADTGPGLNAEAQEKLFDPFFTSKAHGLGMGLAISRSIVEAHVGRIWATPNPPHGTVFRFVIPAAEQRQ